MSGSDRLPTCSRCGKRQPPGDRVAMEDGTPISAEEYLALAALVADALVCGACVTALAGGDCRRRVEWPALPGRAPFPQPRGSG